MASLTLRTKGLKFLRDDEYMTPPDAFNDIAHLIPTDKVIWEPFYGDGKSGEYLKKLGFKIEHKEIDFYDDPSFHYDILISNPPYSDKTKVFKRLREINKPFMMLLPVSTMTKIFLKTYFKDEIQIVIPKKRIQFVKNGEQNNRCWFDTLWICYDMKFDKDITFL